ncbi:MAG: nucleoside kinase [Lachnospiraceae bacterium]|nr:nucleoside kinase [Candidatus Merdinaster equi]
MARITIGEVTKEYPVGTSFEAIASEYQKEFNDEIALVKVNGKMCELIKKVTGDAQISFVTFRDSAGHKAYARSIILLLVKAAKDVFGEDVNASLKVEFTVGSGLYVSVKGAEVSSSLTFAVRRRMDEMVLANLPITKTSYPTAVAREIFKSNGMDDKYNLFRYRRSSTVNVYELDGYKDYFYGYMLPSTGYLQRYELIRQDNGFIVNLPRKTDPKKMPDFELKENLYQALVDSTKWSNQFGIDNVGDLNDHICHGAISDLIMVQEAQQERRIGEIAREIVDRGNVKFVMIAGPSSSGKTSFSHRLSIELRTLGLNPHPIACDDYFVDREQTPKDADGNYNFECLEAIDIKLFNDQMTALLRGERVELPTFNFKAGRKEYKGNFKQLGPDDILVIEGIHCLNDKLSYTLPKDSKYKIYISALTTLNIDNHNRIPTTDVRLLRRMVRDFRTRGASAKRTLSMWRSVRKGEEENIFPFQETADVMFNSALIYELSVLKQFAEPLLFGIEPDEPEYDEANRLLKFLDYFLGITSEHLPNNSLVREFVGGSVFPV